MFVGMDVDQVEAAAQSLARQAEAIRATLQSVDALVSQAAGVWPGPDSVAFNERWRGGMRAELDAGAARLEQAAGNLRQQVEEQRASSGEAGSGLGGAGTHATPVPDSAGRGLSGDAADLTRIMSTGRDAMSDMSWGLSLMGGLASLGVGATKLSSAAFYGPRSGAWARAGSWVDHRNSPVLRSLHGALAPHNKFLVEKGAGNLGLVGKALKPITYTLSGALVLDNAAQGNWEEAGIGAATLGATAMKHSGSPHAYLGGVAVQSVTEVWRAASKTDWSHEGTKQTMDFMRTNPSEAALGAVEGVEQVPGMMLRIFE